VMSVREKALVFRDERLMGATSKASIFPNRAIRY
jgi:hypothetical protein